MSSIYNLGQSVYNYFYPPKDLQIIAVKNELAYFKDLPYFSYEAQDDLQEHKKIIQENPQNFEDFLLSFFSNPYLFREYLDYLIDKNLVSRSTPKLLPYIDCLHSTPRLPQILEILQAHPEILTDPESNTLSVKLVSKHVLEKLNNCYGSYTVNQDALLNIFRFIDNTTGNIFTFFKNNGNVDLDFSDFIDTVTLNLFISTYSIL
ncbi:MAG: hypothetical protein S4CHLAM7_00170 [Chlamydiae bacterium]|nr:hypothetical protein [Chlamydiota bacterium]